MLITERFKLPTEFVDTLREREVPWGFGLFSEIVYYRTYSRMKEDGTQETWADTVERVVNGVLSIRKDWYKKHGLKWDDIDWLPLAIELARAIFELKMLPPGRGLWAMGTDYIYERGSMALNNCGFVDIKDDLANEVAWAMDALMCGVGVGFSTQNARIGTVYRPEHWHDFVVPDSREGWVESVRALIQGFTDPTKRCEYRFDYSEVRPEGSPIRGFGGLASGPEPLRKLHERLSLYLYRLADGHVSQTRTIVDMMNAVGACVVAGNVRRSAELATGAIRDQTFLDLKNYEQNPERAEIGWMSNNSVVLEDAADFELLPSITDRIRDNGEPGIINMINVQKYGRYGKKMEDKAVGFNPCAEIPLESFELCNLAEFYPTRCDGLDDTWRAMELATFYSSTVALLPSHDYRTNAVVARNRRVGVSPSGIADWLDSSNLSYITMALRRGYEEHVQPMNEWLAQEAGVPQSVRLTTVKPSGTISLLAGVSPGMHWPVGRYMIRRFRIATTNPLVQRLIDAGIPHEVDAYSDNTLCFSFPLASGAGKTRGVNDVSIWEQMALGAMLQREWADNAVSNTMTFKRSERDEVERVLAAFAPLMKSISMLPDQEDADHQYVQLPFERITKKHYEELCGAIETVDFDGMTGMDGMDTRFCDTDTCEIPE